MPLRCDLNEHRFIEVLFVNGLAFVGVCTLFDFLADASIFAGVFSFLVLYFLPFIASLGANVEENMKN